MNTINQILDGIAGWLGKRINLVLILLLLQIGIFVGLMRVPLKPAASSALPAVTQAAESSRSISGSACGPWQISFSTKAPLGDIRRWMINFNANIVAGPNETGAFEISVPGQTADSIGESLGELADSVKVNPLCPSGK